MDITPHLTLRGTLRRSSPSLSASGAWPDNFQAVKTGVSFRISQPSAPNALVGFQEVADLEPVVLFEVDEDVREHDQLVVTGGDPAHFVGTTWDLRGVVSPSVAVYKRATGRRIQTGAG